VRKKFEIGRQEIKEDGGEWGMPKWILFTVINKRMRVASILLVLSLLS